MFTEAPMDLAARLHVWLLGEGLNLLKIIVVTLILMRGLRWLTNRAPKWAQDPGDPQRQQQIRTMAGVLDGVGQVCIVAFAGATALREIGLDVRPALAGAGVAGLAIGLGAQNIVRDALNGIFILLDNQYGIGDTIRAGQITGTVEQMTLRRTLVRDGAGALHSIPNGELRIVANLTRIWAQGAVTVPVAPNQPIGPVIEILKTTGKTLAGMSEFSLDLLAAPEILGVERLPGPQLEIMVQVRTRAGRQDAVSRAWRMLIKESFEEKGILFQDPNSFRPRNSDIYS